MSAAEVAVFLFRCRDRRRPISGVAPGNGISCGISCGKMGSKVAARWQQRDSKVAARWQQGGSNVAVTAWGGGVALLGERVARLNIGFCKILENFAKSSCAANSFK